MRMSVDVMLVAISMMLCHMESEACENGSGEPFNLFLGLVVIFGFINCLIVKCTVTVAKKFDTSCGPMSVSRYVGMTYSTPQLSKNTVGALVNATVVTGKAFITYLYWSSGPTMGQFLDFVFVN